MGDLRGAGLRPTVIAVPARDEAERIGACLGALLDQRALDGGSLASGLSIVVLANNCRDGTAEAARRASRGVVRVVSVELPPDQANAGGARRAAMDAAAGVLPSGGGVICTTDADSRPRPDWIARVWDALDAGAEAVAGAVDLDGEDDVRIAFSEGRRSESAYSALQAELVARIDPELHNPWPNHLWAWGANLAVTSDAYRRVGGLPPWPLAEDRAFVDRLRRHDVPVRHCLAARVWTSSRREGRAPGGLADLVADHAAADAAPCDAALEPAIGAARRAAWRRRLRQAHAGAPLGDEWASALGVERRELEAALAASTFGEGWSRLEARSPRLSRRRLLLGELEREIALAERLLRRLRPRGGADPADTALAASAGLWSAASPP